MAGCCAPHYIQLLIPSLWFIFFCRFISTSESKAAVGSDHPPKVKIIIGMYGKVRSMSEKVLPMSGFLNLGCPGKFYLCPQKIESMSEIELMSGKVRINVRKFELMSENSNPRTRTTKRQCPKILINVRNFESISENRIFTRMSGKVLYMSENRILELGFSDIDSTFRTF